MIHDYFPEIDGNQSVDLGKLGRRLHKGGGGGNTTSTTKMEPAAEVKPYLAPFLSQAWGVSQQPYETYQGQRVASLTPEQYMSSGLTSAQALNGFQGQGDAMGNYADTMRGGFYGADPSSGFFADQANGAMNDPTAEYQRRVMRGDYLSPGSNPYLRQSVNYALGDISNAYRNGTKPQTDAAMARTGAFGGSAWQSAVSNNERQLADSLGRTATEYYGRNYENERANQGNAANVLATRQAQAAGMLSSQYANERQNQMQGLNMIPTMQNIGYTDASKLASVGDNFRQYQQDLLNTNYSDWQEAQNYPTRMLDIFGNQLRATMGAGGSTSTSQSGGYKPSPFASALGGGIAGYGLTQGPLGAGVGALAGLLG